jgi:hypothetical protein
LGYPSQYIRGDGTLADFPTSGGGGSSVSYYFNGGTSQGTIGGTTYYEMSKTADTGTGVDFNKTGDGFIVAFLTDAGDPSLLQIPAGNWDFEIYASMSSNGGTPELYAELYKYDGTTFTLIATSSHEILYDGVNLNLYSFATAVPQTSLTVTDRLAIKLYADNSGGKTTTIHTQDSHLCQVITTFSTGLTALNGLTAQVQYFGTGTSGSDFNIVSSVDTHTFNLPNASATKRGALSAADWYYFNGKQDYITAGTTLEYWRGDKTWQTLNTSIVPELTNLYFTDARARTAISLTTTGSTGASTYNNSTGVLNIPNYADQYVGTVTSVGLSAPTGFSVSGSPVTSSGTLALSFASGYSLPTNVKQSNWDDAYTWVAAFPTQTGNNGKFLTTDGSSLSWAANPLGTVTSVAMSVPTGLTVSGSPITTSGTLAVTLTAGYSIPTTANQSTWTTAYNRSLTSAAVTGTTTKTLTLNQQDGGTITASWTDINTDAVTSVFGRTGAVVATEGDYTLTQLGDVTITSPTSGQVLKYNGTAWINDTDANTGTVTSVAMTVPTGLSIAGSPITSSGTLAVTFAAGYSIPTNASQTTWDTAYTNRITSLTTTGTSGAATLVSNVLNIPQYQAVLTNPVTGTGNNNYIAKFTSTGSTIGNSIIQESGGNIGIGITPNGNLQFTSVAKTRKIVLYEGANNDYQFYGFGVESGKLIYSTFSAGDDHVFVTGTSSTTRSTLMTIKSDGTILMGTVTTGVWQGTAIADAYISSAATWNAKQGAITLTTTGTSGAATFVSNTLNIPQYQSVLSNPVTGTGTNNVIPKFTSTGSTVGDSIISNTGASSEQVTISKSGNHGTRLDINNATDGTVAQSYIGLNGTSSTKFLNFGKICASFTVPAWLDANAGYIYNGTGNLILYNETSNIKLLSNGISDRYLMVTSAIPISVGNGTIGGRYEFYKDGTPSKAGSIGIGMSGDAAGDNIMIATYNASTNWVSRITVLNSNGNVGIANPSPSYSLDVKSSARILNDTGANSITNFYVAADKAGSSAPDPYNIGGIRSQFVDSAWLSAKTILLGSALTGYGSPTERISFLTDGTNLITSMSGFVGIGTPSPTYKFETLGTSVITAAFGRSDYGATNVMLIAMNGYRDVYKQAIGVIRTGDYDKGDMVFCLNDSANSTVVSISDVRARITSAGLFGIGCTPTEKLTIEGAVIRLQGGAGVSPFAIANNNSTGFRVYDYTASVDRLVILPSGYMGVGTSTPITKMEVRYNGNNGGGDYAGYNILATTDSTSTVYQATIGAMHQGAGYANLNLGSKDVGGLNIFWHISKRLAADGHRLEYYYYNGSGFVSKFYFTNSGDFWAAGDVTAYSDISVKENIRPIENVLTRINNSRGVLYDRIDTKTKNNIGFIAQELEKEFPELISTNTDGTKGVKYQNAVAVLFEAIKEQQKQINELKSKN